MKITDAILLKNGFVNVGIVNNHECFKLNNNDRKMVLYKSDEGGYFYETVGIDFKVTLISEINAYYKQRTGRNIII